VLYGSGFAGNHNQTTIIEAYRHFAESFGGLEPFIIREVSWQVYTPFEVAWGAALNGAQGNTGTVAVGPGYNDSAVPGRTTPIRDRENGEFYKRSWRQALTWGKKFVFVETWNEFHEGTDVARSREYGDLFIRLTRYYADIHKGSVRFTDPAPSGWVRSLSVDVAIVAQVNHGNALNPQSVRCRYSSDGGSKWSEHPAVAVAQGDTAYLLKADNVPFGATSGVLSTPNRFVFHISNAVGDTVFESLPQPVWLGYPPAVEAIITLGNQNDEQGLHHVASSTGDGWTAGGMKGELSARYNMEQNPGPNPGNYFYFQVHDSLISDGSDPEVWVEISYWDGSGTGFELQYDSRGDAFADRYRSGGSRSIAGRQEWRTASYHLLDARFGNRQNSAADFRIYASGTVWLHSVRVYTRPRTLNVQGDRTLVEQREAALREPYPNPFNASVVVPVWVPDGERASVRIVNAVGQTIKEWGALSGSHSLVWTGTDHTGREVASGVYFVHLRNGEVLRVKRVVLTR
jgi:hypothetical protein